MYATTILDENFSVASIGAFKLYKKNLNKTLLLKQKSGDSVEWQNDNFVLYNSLGLRQSNLQREPVDYSIFCK